MDSIIGILVIGGIVLFFMLLFCLQGISFLSKDLRYLTDKNHEMQRELISLKYAIDRIKNER